MPEDQPTTTRAEHLAWCKQRALQELAFYLKESGPREACKQAMASMSSDLRKHPATAQHAGIQLGMMFLMSNQREAHDTEAMTKFINGFN